MNPYIDTTMPAIAFDAIEFTETPTPVVDKAIRKYETSQPKFLEADDVFSPDSTWGRLANQVVGHEEGQ